MSKINIQGDYIQAGDHLIRYEDRQVLHIHRGTMPRKPVKKRYDCELFLISPQGHRTRISGLYRTSASDGASQYSFDWGGWYYRLTISDHQAATITRGKPKGDRDRYASTATNATSTKADLPPIGGRMLVSTATNATSGSDGAYCITLTASVQLELW